MTSQIPQIARDYAKRAINKDGMGDKDFHRYISGMIECWKMDGFKNKLDAKGAYLQMIIGTQIRAYCHRNNLATCEGTYHSFNCQIEHRGLWGIVRAGGMSDNLVDGVRWNYVMIDQLRNLYVRFE